MPIDPDVLERAKSLHDDLEAAGLQKHAMAVRMAVYQAIEDQEQEEAFGSDNMRSCIEAHRAIAHELTRLAASRPITNESVARSLSECVPHVRTLSAADEGPKWYWSRVSPGLRRISRLADALRGTEPKTNASSTIHVMLADCIREFGAVDDEQVVGENQR